MRWHALALIAAVLFPSSLAAREWIDDSGQFRREAEYLYQREGKVWLRGAGGKVYAIAPQRLSEADREYIASLARPAGSSKAKTAAMTLGYQIPKFPADGGEAATSKQPQGAVNPTFAKLTGWRHCRSFCVPTIVHCPTPSCCPVPPDTGKRIYKGCYSTFHLVCRDPKPQICGTGAYKFLDQQGCCHEYLVRLYFVLQTSPPAWLIYEVVPPVPLGIHFWLFENVSFSKCCYNVYYWHNNSWQYYECSCRRIPE